MKMILKRNQVIQPKTIIICTCLSISILIYSPIKAQDYDDTVVGTTNDDTTESRPDVLKNPERVTVVAPKYLRPQSDYHVLVNLANSKVPASIDLQITGARDSNREQVEAKSVLANSGETQTVKFNIGDWQPAEYMLSVNVQAVDRSWNFTQEKQLTYQAKSYSGFIQTDKAIYKPGQLVQFRAIFLSQTLTPLVLKEQINITINDAKKNIVKQWINQSNYRGLISLDLQLSEDPVLGDWTILVEARNQQFSKQFRVAEYILPTFDVDIQLPSYATYNQSNIVATVKASYTYGKPVNGHVTLTVQPLVRFYQLDTRPLHQAQYRARLVEGSADISLDLMKDLKQKRDLFEREIEFFALVEEDLTGRTYNKSKIMKIYDKHVKVEQINAEERFKPGLNYYLQLKVAYQDDTPVENNGPLLKLKVEAEGVSLNEVNLRPVNGIVDYLIDVPKKINSTQLNDRMVTPTYIQLEINYRGHTYFLNRLFAYNSLSQEYLQVSLPQLISRNSILSNPSRRSAANRSQAISIDDDLKVKVTATEQMQQVTCQGLARGDIVWALSREAKNQTEFEFEVKVDQRMAPEATILCFYIRPENKELITDSTSVPVNGLIKNGVKLTTSRDEAKPGQDVEVSIFTKPNSLVGLLGIDQSVLLLKTGNDISQQDLSNEIKSYGSSTSKKIIREANNAEDLFHNSDVVILTNNFVYNGLGFREGRLLYAAGNYASRSNLSPAAGQLGKLVSLDSFILESEIKPPEFHLKKTKVDPLIIRTFFPETWFWENSTAGLDGVAKFKAKAPDTITSWVLSAFSINENYGFGLSNQKSSVRVFRPFFIKLNLPYSIIRGETVNIQAIVFNYSKRPTKAKVTLENSNDEFEFVVAANDIEDEKRSNEESESRIISIPAQDGVAVSFLIRPKKLGNIAIKVVALSEFAADGIVKKLLVKAEGQTQYLNKAFLINLAGPQTRITRNFSIDIPVNAVPNSQKVFVSAMGDLIGPGLSNVDDLLRLPYGCGEQNMVNLVPNIVILNYLKNTRRLRDIQRTRAVRNIENGYQRQLNYKRKDGSFSAFGNSDASGSVWLTSYVLKTLQQAKTIITVDEMVIRRAANFIASHSRSDGSIEEVGMIHDKRLQSDIANNSPTTYLTAYAMIALLQKPIQPNNDAPAPVALDEVLDKGLGYLENQLDAAYSNENPYELIAIAYTLNLANRQNSMDQAYEKMWLKAQENQDFIWWEDKSERPKVASSDDNGSTHNAKLSTLDSEQPEDSSDSTSVETFKKKPSNNVTAPPLKPLPNNKKHSAHSFIPDSLSIEMTALALLTTVKRGELERALPIVKWLISKQNSKGGFASTQDTMLAIEALAAFAEASSTSTAPLSIDVDLLFPRISPTSTYQASGIRRNNIEQLLISQNNALVQQQIRLPDNITWVQVQATGAGTAVIQISWQYNLLVSAEQPAFYLNPILDKTSNINYLQLSVCTFYKAGDASNMAVMEVELPSGYVADVEALPGLKRTKEIKRIETAEGDTKVIIYFDKVTRNEICLTVPAHRASKVSNNRPIAVSIYDYYNRQQTARIFYEPDQASSCDICDQDTCSALCSSKPKRSEKLISLHEQRKINRFANLTQPATNSSPTSNSSSSSDNVSLKPYQLLPLAPVMVTLIALTRNLTTHHPTL